MVLTTKQTDIKLKISALWASRILTGLLGDIIRFFQPGFLEETISGTTDFAITDSLLLPIAIIFGIPIFMIYPTLTLNDKINSRLNIVVGTLYLLLDIVFLISVIFAKDPAFEIFLGFIYAIYTGLITWNAWKWKNEE